MGVWDGVGKEGDIVRGEGMIGEIFSWGMYKGVIRNVGRVKVG